MAHENRCPRLRRHARSCVVLTAAALSLTATGVCAYSSPGGTLPWDQPLNTVAALLTGPIAHTFIAFALTVAFLIYGIQGNCEPASRLLKAGLTTAGAVAAVKLLNYLLPY